MNRADQGAAAALRAFVDSIGACAGTEKEVTVQDQANQTTAINEPKRFDPIDIIASVIADGRGANAAGISRVGRQTRKKAQAVLDALADAGWRVLRK